MNLLDLFGNAQGLEGLIDQKQIAGVQSNALLNAGLAMLAAGQGGQPGVGRASLGAGLLQGLQAGQGAFKSGIESQVGNVLTAQKIAELRRQQQIQERLMQLQQGMGDFVQQATGGGQVSPEQALSVPGMPAGPTAARAALIGQPTAAPMSTEKAKALYYRKIASEMGVVDPSKAEAYAKIADSLDPPFEYAAKETELGSDGRPTTVLYGKRGQRQVTGNTPYEAPPPEIRAVEYITGRPLAGAGQPGMDAVGNYNRSKATNVQVGGPDKTFENENTLRSQYNALPQVKAFTEIDLAHKQIKAALAKPSAAGDLAAATKYMKILDPGSVVRESELGLAMAATGKLDQWSNLLNKFKTGQLLTPSQREEFGRLADEMYSAAASVVAPLQDQYRGVANSYKLDAGRIMSPITMDSSARPSAGKPDPLGLRGK